MLFHGSLYLIITFLLAVALPQSAQGQDLTLTTTYQKSSIVSNLPGGNESSCVPSCTATLVQPTALAWSLIQGADPQLSIFSESYVRAQPNATTGSYDATVTETVTVLYNLTDGTSTQVTKLLCDTKTANDTDAEGTAITALELRPGVTTTLAYPTQLTYFAEPDYFWSGVLPTGTGNDSSCASQSAAATVSYPSDPPQLAPSYPNINDIYGSCFTPVLAPMTVGADWFGSAYPSESALQDMCKQAFTTALYGKTRRFDRDAAAYSWNNTLLRRNGTEFNGTVSANATSSANFTIPVMVSTPAASTATLKTALYLTDTTTQYVGRAPTVDPAGPSVDPTEPTTVSFEPTISPSEIATSAVKPISPVITSDDKTAGKTSNTVPNPVTPSPSTTTSAGLGELIGLAIGLLPPSTASSETAGDSIASQSPGQSTGQSQDQTSKTEDLSPAESGKSSTNVGSASDQQDNNGGASKSGQSSTSGGSTSDQQDNTGSSSAGSGQSSDSSGSSSGSSSTSDSGAGPKSDSGSESDNSSGSGSSSGSSSVSDNNPGSGSGSGSGSDSGSSSGSDSGSDYASDQQDNNEGTSTNGGQSSANSASISGQHDKAGGVSEESGDQSANPGSGSDSGSTSGSDSSSSSVSGSDSGSGSSSGSGSESASDQKDTPGGASTKTGQSNTSSSPASDQQDNTDDVPAVAIVPPAGSSTSEYVIGGQTIKAGGQAVTAGGTTYDVAEGGSAIIVNGVTSPVHGGSKTQANIQVVPVTPAAGSSISEYIVAGQTIAPGSPAIVVSGTTYSAAQAENAVVINGVTSSVTQAESAEGTRVANVEAAGSSISAFIFKGQTAVAGGADVVESGTTYSLAQGGSAVVVNGVTSSLSPVPAGSNVVLGEITATATAIPAAINTGSAVPALALGGQTLTAGNAVTISGTTYSLAKGASAIVINDVTSTLASGETTVFGKLTATLTVVSETGQTIVDSGTTYTLPSFVSTLSSGGIVIGSQTLLSGSTISVAGKTLTLGTSGIVQVVEPSSVFATDSLASALSTAINNGGETTSGRRSSSTSDVTSITSGDSASITESSTGGPPGPAATTSKGSGSNVSIHLGFVLGSVMLAVIISFC